MSREYLIISPCRNEAKYMRETLDSISRQTLLPAKWVIVDDGSTDETPDILKEYSEKYPWIQVVTRPDRGRRAVGPGVIEAFYDGYNAINPDDFQYVCKLDLDLILPPGYFEKIIRRMELNPRLGTCSGKSYIRENGRLVSERKGDETSLGMAKFYRLECFKEIGGFVKQVMWDGIDCHYCRMKGWAALSWDEPDLNFIHLRPMGTSQVNVYIGRMRHGFGQYFMGTSFLYIFASSIYRMTEKPYVLGGLAMLWGWLRSALTAAQRIEDSEFRSFLRRYQMRALLFGKQRAISYINKKYNIPSVVME